jgi:DNA mismatch repair protein MutS
MQQYFLAKEQYPDAIIFFRMGDFYEMFYDDAVRAAGLLEITLTSRGNDQKGKAIPMAGVPHHSASGYIARLLERGQRVAICEQMEDPTTAKGVVRREVVRVVTPGLVLDLDALDDRTNNYLASVVLDGDDFGLAAFELTTAEVMACTVRSRADLLAELVRIDPREVLVHDRMAEFEAELRSVLARAVFRPLGDSQVTAAREEESIVGMIDSASGKAGNSVVGEAGFRAAAAVLRYAQDTQPGVSLGVQRVAPYDPTDHLGLDDAAVRNLEIVQTISGSRQGSLIQLVDVTRTSMGARSLRRRLLSPLRDITAIRRRHDRVERMVRDSALRDRIREVLSEIGDLERLSTRAALGVATPRDLAAIRDGLRGGARLRQYLEESQERTTDDAFSGFLSVDICADVFERLNDALVAEPPVVANNGGIFANAYHPRISELRELSASSKDIILNLEKKERERTGISSLRIRFTRVFGYYIEVTKPNLASVPDDYRRKQTVATGERFTTEELDTLQTEILNADERLRVLENELFEEIRHEIGKSTPRLRALATTIADLDVHAAFADVAHRFDYVRPVIDDSFGLEFGDSRHPIVERTLPRGEFVPNDVRLNADGYGLMIITGPNMAGKSTVMRQVALSVILAQAGGFVPAAKARIGVVDRIFTRVGASDAVARGLSTFMVEMRETAAILHGATRRSLVVLDEIGRGTSTYDGLAIAWAITEYLHDAVGCRTMFATHYHELCELAATREGVVNFNVAAKEYRNDVVFLRKLVPGGANRSYGIAVGHLAGIPMAVLRRAKAILKDLETGAALPSGIPASLRGKTASGAVQLDMFAPPAAPAPPSEVEASLRDLDIEEITPVEALVELERLKKMLSEPGHEDD